MNPIDFRRIDQHQLVEAVFCLSGGQPVDERLPERYQGKKADIVFAEANLIAEVKSLTSDRSIDGSVREKVGAVLAKGAAYGAPIIFGTGSINVNDLPTTVGERVVRVLGARARKVVIAAGRQIEQTRSILSMPEAYGLVAFISPAHVLGQQTLRWLIHDLLKKRGDFAGLDGAMLIQTPICFDGGGLVPGDTFSSLWSISGRPFPEGLGEMIGDAWVALTGQFSRPEDYEDFASHGMTE